MDKYLRIFWPDYQPLMEEHKNEWSTEVGIINDSDGVLIPIKWWEEHIQKLMDEKFILVEKRLKEYFNGTYIKSFYLNMIGMMMIINLSFIQLNLNLMKIIVVDLTMILEK